ncbi:hypothetical protein GCM10011374_41470 [Kocuria dechangensis]|uniref:ANTAR domain-containing protein n=1 Tax=Kocuria dechangensis TaxID=1176249 RepID=A0A917HA53_9MICC|nr:ANTAR domain-containing protein [Kocuria dechangensis]GGG72435.1 hypothetical protein GCM10011374_41470 [Kocuria dechangensis]
MRAPRISASVQLTQIEQVMTALHRRPGSGGRAVAAIAQAGVHHVGAARWASVSMAGPGRFRTLVATAPMAAQADALQHELGSGPAVDPAPGGGIHLVENLARDRRWPALAAQARERLNVAGLVAYHLPLPQDPATTVALTLYADSPDAFTGPHIWTGALLACQAVQAVTTQLRHPQEGRREQGRREQELAAAQQIGVAIGVLMGRYGLSREEAFDMLRTTAQDSDRDLAEVAGEVIETETLRLPPMSAAPHSTGRSGTPRPCGGAR